MSVDSHLIDGFPEIPGYSISKLLGHGQSSHVYLGIQTSLNRPVAIKVLTNPAREQILRFEREARIMASLSHPNVINIIDRGMVDMKYFIAMEFMDSGSLRNQLVSGQPMRISTARRVIASMSAALTMLHAEGLVHRDVKPENVLFDRNGQTKLCDFGISVLDDQIGLLTKENTSPGTLDYMAPEQRYRLDVSEKADQFALAVMVYEMITGFLPSLVFRPPSKKNSLVNESVDTILQRALQEDPEERFPTVSKFVEMLDTALASQFLPVTTPAVTHRPFHHYAILTVLATICTLLIYWVTTGSERLADQSILDRSQQATDTRKDDPSSSTRTIQQTGALPFRMNEAGEIELLLVRAKSGQHWTIPKANQRQDDSQQKIAEEEAFEETGIRGTAVPVVLGNYRYRRNNRLHNVAVIPVHSVEELAVWPEQSRKRLWCSVPTASAMVGSDKLRTIISSFSSKSLEAVAEQAP